MTRRKQKIMGTTIAVLMIGTFTVLSTLVYKQNQRLRSINISVERLLKVFKHVEVRT